MLCSENGSDCPVGKLSNRIGDLEEENTKLRAFLESLKPEDECIVCEADGNPCQHCLMLARI